MPPVLIAAASQQLISKSIACAGLLAFILTGKFADGTPFYRMGVELGRGSMAAWAIKMAQACARLMDLLREEILAGQVGVDEITLQILKEPRRHATTKSFPEAQRIPRSRADRRVLRL